MGKGSTLWFGIGTTLRLQVCVFAGGIYGCKPQLILHEAEKGSKARSKVMAQYHKDVGAIFNAPFGA